MEIKEEGLSFVEMSAADYFALPHVDDSPIDSGGRYRAASEKGYPFVGRFLSDGRWHWMRVRFQGAPVDTATIIPKPVAYGAAAAAYCWGLFCLVRVGILVAAGPSIAAMIYWNMMRMQPAPNQATAAAFTVGWAMAESVRPLIMDLWRKGRAGIGE